MNEVKEITQDLRSAMRRRRALLIATPILFLALSIIVAHLIEPKYQSSTSILVQKDETLNPLVMYEMAVSFTSDDRLKSFNEIIFSRSTMELLIDSLQLDETIQTESEKQSLIDGLRKKIITSSRASDSFEISYLDTDPVRARDGASLLAEHFIRTRLQLENRRNNETVNFFSLKLAEMEEVVEKQRDHVVSSTSGRLRELPADQQMIQSRLASVESQLENIEWAILQEEQKLSILSDFQNHSNPEESIPLLYKLPFGEMQFGNELLLQLNEHESLRQQFTASYPRVSALASKIIQTANRIPPTIQSKITSLDRQKQDLYQQKTRLVNDLERSYVASQRANSEKSDFIIYEELYNEMKVKLEQAKMTRDIGDRAVGQFVVLDAPYIPEKPSKPNKRLIVLLGVFLGGVFGITLSVLAEVMDTTIRTDEQLPIYKPVIAYITDG